MRNEHSMPGKAYRSKLEPFFGLIVENRRKRLTWAEIASLITDKGTQCTRQAVQGYFKRRVARRTKKQEWPMGMDASTALESFADRAAQQNGPVYRPGDNYRRSRKEHTSKPKTFDFSKHVISHED